MTPYPPEDWRMGLALDRHDDPPDHEAIAALREQDDEARDDARRDDR